MSVTFDSLPAVSRRDVQFLVKSQLSRRTLISTMAVLAGTAFTTAGSFFRAAPANAGYFDDWTSTNSGPCGPGQYASGHTENGIKCGPSYADPWYCGAWGWHDSGPRGSYYLAYRPDQCWGGVYDSWRWTFSDGNTYRCSDGYLYTPWGGAIPTICPWAV